MAVPENQNTFQNGEKSLHSNLFLHPPNYHVRCARKGHASMADFCSVDKAKRYWQTSEAQTCRMRHTPGAAAKKDCLLQSPAVQPPGTHLHNL